MLPVRGFCDLNVCTNSENRPSLIRTCETLLELGYKTVAINTFCVGSDLEPKKKKKKGEAQVQQGDLIPEPGYQDVVKHFNGRLLVYQRLTISIEDQLQAHKLSQSPNAKKYNLLAVIPTTPTAYKYVCSSMDVDLISFDPENIGAVKSLNKVHNVAVNRGIYFEIMYTPVIRDSTARKNIIQLAHTYHAFSKCKNVIVSSGAANPLHVRGPYDVVNLSLLFGLSEEQAKGAITTTCRELLISAAGRRLGKTNVIVDKNLLTPIGNGKVDKHSDSENMEVEESEQPVQKKLRQK